MTEAAFAVYLFTLALVCVSVYLCFRCIAWVVANGWRSMLGLVALRGEAVIEWQDQDVKDGTDWPDRHAWDSHTADAILLTHEAILDVDEDAPPEWWKARESELVDLRDLAAQLEGRAS